MPSAIVFLLFSLFNANRVQQPERMPHASLCDNCIYLCGTESWCEEVTLPTLIQNTGSINIIKFNISNTTYHNFRHYIGIGWGGHNIDIRYRIFDDKFYTIHCAQAPTADYFRLWLSCANKYDLTVAGEDISSPYARACARARLDSLLTNIPLHPYEAALYTCRNMYIKLNIFYDHMPFRTVHALYLVSPHAGRRICRWLYAPPPNDSPQGTDGTWTPHGSWRWTWPEPFHVVEHRDTRYFVTEIGRIYKGRVGPEVDKPLELIWFRDPVRAIIHDTTYHKSWVFTASVFFQLGRENKVYTHSYPFRKVKTVGYFLPQAAAAGRLIREIDRCDTAPPPRPVAAK